MIKKFFSYYKPHKKLFIIDLFCAFMSAGLSLFYPILVNRIITDFKADKSLNLIIIVAAILLGVLVLTAIFNFILQYYGHILGVRIQGDMRKELFAHLQTLPFSYFDEHKTGSIMSRIVTDLFEIAELSHHGPEDTFISFVTIIGVFSILFYYNWILALCMFVVMPFMVLFAIVRRQKMRDSFKKAREQISVINAEIESSISGIRVTKAYTAKAKEIEKFDKANKDFMTARGGAYKNMGVFFSGMNAFNKLLYLVTIVIGALLLYFDVRLFGDTTYATFIMFVPILIQPVTILVNISEQIQDGMTGYGRFLEIMAAPSETEPENPVAIDSLNGEIEFKDVCFSYKSKDNPGSTKVIKDLSLKIEKGQTVAFVGPSGGGKTTLCHLIPRFYEIDSGCISIDGIDITDMRREDLRRNVGIVAQDVFLFAGSIKDNIAYGNLNASDEEILAAAKRANIHDFAVSLPSGYDTEVGERGVKLSGGQKQRISIARAFLKNPPILILDEATSALDNITEMQIQSSLEELSKGRTTIIVAHRLSTVKNADEILVLTSSGITERGNHNQLMQQNGFYSHLYSFYN